MEHICSFYEQNYWNAQKELKKKENKTIDNIPRIDIEILLSLLF